MLKIRRSRDRIIFNMGIPIPGKDSIYVKTGPRRPEISCEGFMFAFTNTPLCLILSYWRTLAKWLTDCLSYMHLSDNPVKFIIGVIRTSMTMNLSKILIMPLSTWTRFSTILMMYRVSQAVYELAWTRNSARQCLGGTWHEIDSLNTGVPTGKIIMFIEIELLQSGKFQLQSIFPRNTLLMINPFMLNHSITRSVSSSNMKNAKLSPLYKEGDKIKWTIVPWVFWL